jgi:hypothetical protein
MVLAISNEASLNGVCPILPSAPFNCYKHIANKFGQLELFRECSPKGKLFLRFSVAGNHAWRFLRHRDGFRPAGALPGKNRNFALAGEVYP